MPLQRLNHWREDAHHYVRWSEDSRQVIRLYKPRLQREKGARLNFRVVAHPVVRRNPSRVDPAKSSHLATHAPPPESSPWEIEPGPFFSFFP